MNVIGLGTDIVNINRIKKIYSKYGNQFLNKILTEFEKNPKKNYLDLKMFQQLPKDLQLKKLSQKLLDMGFQMESILRI